jgi:hypothetical protein
MMLGKSIVCRPPLSSCADLIRASTWSRREVCLPHGVDGRVKPGHDGNF